MDTLDDLNRRYESNVNARTFVQWCRAIALSGDDVQSALAVFERAIGRNAIFARFEKAAVGVLTGTSNSDLALSRLSAEFLTLVARRSLLGRLSAIGSLPLPLGAPAPLALTGANADFVAVGAPSPVASLTTGSVMTGSEKLALILGIVKRLLLSDDPRAISLLERHLQKAVREGEDRALLSDDAAVAGERPAGLLSGIVAHGGGSPGSLAEDIRVLWSSVRDGDAERPVFVASPNGGMYLASLNLAGEPLFPNARPIDGGDLFGVPLLISPAADARLILIDAAAIGVSDNGMRVDASGNASVQMDSEPSAGATGTVSAFQGNISFIRMVRFVSWALAYADAVAYIQLAVPSSGSPA